MQGVALGWQIFSLHHRPFDLGLVGLALFLPSALLAIISGFVADHVNRRTILVLATSAEIVATLGVIALVVRRETHIAAYLAVIAGIGIARAFARPAERSLLAMLVSGERYLRVSSALNAASEIVVIGGPALGGALVAAGMVIALGVTVAMLAAVTVAFAFLAIPAAVRSGAAATLSDALAGLRFIRAQPVIFGAISLDLFAVLFGGATALLPAYAQVILHVGPIGFGALRAAPALGAFVLAVYLARRPPGRRVGRTLLVAVTIFGLATIVFGISHSLVLSLVALAFAGGADMISVVIRSALVQLNTPDAMRGRVNAVELVFIGASNELGAFESGTLAALIGTVPSVVAGGCATLAVVVCWALAFPHLARADRIAQQQAG
jgi:MFS family permease